MVALMVCGQGNSIGGAGRPTRLFPIESAAMGANGEPKIARFADCAAAMGDKPGL